MASEIQDAEKSLRYFARIQNDISRRLSHEVRKSYPPNLYEPIKYALNLRGKRLRPLLTIISCEAVGGSVPECIDAAVAIEMLHCFTLVHDDIMDGDRFRRGKPTIHERWDSNVAILTGDALIALAYQALLRVDSLDLNSIIRIFSRGIVEVCEGQSLDKDFESIDGVSTNEYLRMIHWKTAILLSISAEIGAILGNGTEAGIIALKKFGTNLGMAFQIQDDLLDIVAEEELLGKDLGSDLAQGKKTYPLLLFKERAPREYDRVMERIRKRGKITTRELTHVKRCLEDNDIITDIEREVHRLISRACGIVRKAEPPLRSHQLIAYAGMIENRVY